MSDRAPVGEEIDALKVYVWGMFAVSVVGAGLVWWIRGRADELRVTVDSAKRALPELAEQRNEIEAMLKAYKGNKEDEARDSPLTWFQARWKEVGIDEQRIQPDQWKSPADTGPDGSYWEEKIALSFLSKNPLRREQIAKFLHQVEHSSSRLRILTLNIGRAGRDDSVANDEWRGKCEVGYRYPRTRE